MLYGTNRVQVMVDAEETLRDEDRPAFYLINAQGLYVPKGRQKVQCKACTFGTCEEVCAACGGTGKLSPRNAKPIPNDIATMPWDCVIWDETVEIKNPKSQANWIAHNCFGGSQVRCRAGLTGEAAPEGPLDLFEQMRWIYGSFMSHTNFWKWRHDNFQQHRYDWHPKPGKADLIKRSFHAKAYVITRQDAGVREERTFLKRWCDLPPKIRKVYDDVEKYLEIPEPDGGFTTTKYGVVASSWLAQVAGGFPKHFPQLDSPHKLDLLEEVVREYPNEPLVIVFRFNEELKRAYGRLSGREQCRQITGEVPPNTRREIQRWFHTCKNGRLLLQANVGRFGMNLSAASTMIRYSFPLDWNTISQGMARIAGTGKPLAYIDLGVRDTVDEDRLSVSGDKGVTARWYMRKVESHFKLRVARKKVA